MDRKESQVPSKKESIRALRMYTTLTNAEIFHRVGVSRSAGYRLMRGTREEDPTQEQKETRGRKRKLNDEVVDSVLRTIDAHPNGEHSQSWDELARSTGMDGISGITVKRAVEDAGYYKCGHCQRISKMHGLGKYRKPQPTNEGEEVPVILSPAPS